MRQEGKTALVKYDKSVLNGGTGAAPPEYHEAVKSILSWLGLAPEAAQEPAPLRELVDALDQLEPERAQHLARFAYLLGKTSNLLFSGTADFEIARDFAQTAAYDEKVRLARCLFAVASTDEAISMAEETEIHRILNVLRIEPSDLTALRVQHKRQLPGMNLQGGGKIGE